MLTIQELKRRTDNKLGFESDAEFFKDALRETVERFSVDGHKPAKTRRLLNDEFFPAECWFRAKWDESGSEFLLHLDNYEDRIYDIKYPEQGNKIQFSLPITFSLSERQVRIWKKDGDVVTELKLKDHNFVSGNTIILDELYSAVADFSDSADTKARMDVEYAIEINRWATPYPRGLYFTELEENVQSIQKVVLRDKVNGFTYNLNETDLLSIDSDSRANNSYIHYDGCLLLFTSIDITTDAWDVFVSHVDQNTLQDMIDDESRWQEKADLDRNYTSMYVCNLAIKILEWAGEDSDQLKVQYAELNRWVKQYKENLGAQRSSAVQKRIQVRSRRY